MEPRIGIITYGDDPHGHLIKKKIEEQHGVWCCLIPSDELLLRGRLTWSSDSEAPGLLPTIEGQIVDVRTLNTLWYRRTVLVTGAIVPSCSHKSYFRTFRTHDMADNSTPTETSRTSWQQRSHMLLVCVWFRCRHRTFAKMLALESWSSRFAYRKIVQMVSAPHALFYSSNQGRTNPECWPSLIAFPRADFPTYSPSVVLPTSQEHVAEAH
jgi:hypothetical protein